MAGRLGVYSAYFLLQFGWTRSFPTGTKLSVDVETFFVDLVLIASILFVLRIFFFDPSVAFLSAGRSRRPPAVILNGIVFVFRSGEGWDFSFQGIEFYSSDDCLECPTVAELEKMATLAEAYRTEMLDRIQKHFTAGRRRADPYTASFEIGVTDWAKNRTFDVTWFGQNGWGRTTVSFTFQNSALVNELWVG